MNETGNFQVCLKRKEYNILLPVGMNGMAGSRAPILAATVPALVVAVEATC